MKRVAILGSMLIALGTHQSAKAADDLCFERVYDQAHLRKHKLQEVTRLRLHLDAGAVTTGKIAAAFRESPDYRSSNVECVAKDKATRCDILADGGDFSFTITPKGIRLLNTSLMRFGDEEDGVSIGREIEHRVFLLFKVGSENCTG
jgi:hypothetical protein